MGVMISRFWNSINAGVNLKSALILLILKPLLSSNERFASARRESPFNCRFCISPFILDNTILVSSNWPGFEVKSLWCSIAILLSRRVILFAEISQSYGFHCNPLSESALILSSLTGRTAAGFFGRRPG